MISPRLDMILRNVSGATVADIGTDHAFVPIELARLGKKVIATDANSGPLISAKRNIEKYNLDISLRLGSGLFPLSCGEAEEIIIAGMGGELISTIINDGLSVAKKARLILQPMNSQAELRKFLITHGFIIVHEDLAKEGRKLYNLIIAEYGESALPDKEIGLHLPPLLYYHSLFPFLIEKKEREFTKQFNGLSASKSAAPAELQHIKSLLDDTIILKNSIKDVIL